MFVFSITLGLLLTSIKDLMVPEQRPNIDSPVALLPPAFERSTSSQARKPCFTAVHTITTFLAGKKGPFVYPTTFSSVKSDPVGIGDKLPRQLYQSGDVEAEPTDILTPTATESSQATATLPLTTDSLATLASSTSISGSTHGNANTPNVQTQNLVPVPSLAALLSVTPGPSTTVSNVQGPEGNIALAQGTITSSPSPAIASKPKVTSSTGPVTANSKSQASSPSSQALVFDPTIALGSRSLGAATPASSKIPPLLTIGGKTVTANSLGQYNIDGQILTPGGTVTVSSTVISLASDETDAIVGTSTEALGSPFTGKLGSGPVVATRPDLTLGTQTLTSNSLGQYNIDGETLTPGGAITVSGIKISLAPGGSDVVVGTKTEALGPYITAGLRSGPNGTEGQEFQGSARGAQDGLRSPSMVLLVGFAVLLWL